jgi:hypothetical protein
MIHEHACSKCSSIVHGLTLSDLRESIGSAKSCMLAKACKLRDMTTAP